MSSESCFYSERKFPTPMVVRLSYKINSRQFRARLDICHLIMFVVCFIAAASITTINIIEGIPKRYTSLQFSN